jgi:hypothetical protein
MTSQVILGNGHGIAIASDSAVTMGQRRTYDTSEKIYPLPSPHALAVLHAGDVNFHGMPYSTIINSWIQTLGDVQLRFVDDYALSFRKFLVEELHVWCDPATQNLDFIEAMDGEFNRIWNRLKKENESVSLEVALSIWKSEIDGISGNEPYGKNLPEWVENKFKKVWISQHQGYAGISDRADYWFDDVPRTSEIDELIQQYVRQSIARHYPLSDENYALLTFTGYGFKSLIPSALKLVLHGAIDDSIMWDQDDLEWASRNGSGFLLIELMGQCDAIYAFLRGYDNKLVKATESALSNAIKARTVANSNPETENEGKDSSQSIASITESANLGEMIDDAFGTFAEKNSLGAFRGTVSGMPLATLSTTAKSLIDIQRLSLDIRGRMPTVGGPVKVGTITKTRGFEWVDSSLL